MVSVSNKALICITQMLKHRIKNREVWVFNIKKKSKKSSRYCTALKHMIKEWKVGRQNKIQSIGNYSCGKVGEQFERDKVVIKFKATVCVVQY